MTPPAAAIEVPDWPDPVDRSDPNSAFLVSLATARGVLAALRLYRVYIEAQLAKCKVNAHASP